jgi:hypothetical protein
LTIGIVEMSNAFYIRNILNETVRDAARRFAIGAMNPDQTEAFILEKVAEIIDANASVVVTESDTTEAEKSKEAGEASIDDVTITLTVPFDDILLFENLSGGLITFAGSNPNMTFSATMLKY